MHPWAERSFVDGAVLFNRLEAPIGARPPGRRSDRRRGPMAAGVDPEGSRAVRSSSLDIIILESFIDKTR